VRAFGVAVDLLQRSDVGMSIADDGGDGIEVITAIDVPIEKG
jgi:hypothetical protein